MSNPRTFEDGWNLAVEAVAKYVTINAWSGLSHMIRDKFAGNPPPESRLRWSMADEADRDGLLRFTVALPGKFSVVAIETSLGVWKTETTTASDLDLAIEARLHALVNVAVSGKMISRGARVTAWQNLIAGLEGMDL